MPVEKLRELDDCLSPSNGCVDGQHHFNNNNNKENGVTSISTSPITTTKNGLLNKSGSKLGFSKRKTTNNHHSNGNDANGGHHGNGHNSGSGHGKRIDDPFRFSGDGIDFKAKLIGVREVNDARGDQMCQDAMQLCKALVKSSGQHKQRILFNVSVEGLKIKELTNGHSVHSFPVNKVSFIAKDVTDNRAFGFVYGSPDEKHRFYAIKTEKTSDQVVLSIRDMFHVVYEMKKKQIEEAKQNKDSNSQQESHNEINGVNLHSNGNVAARDEGGVAVADLLDLETELQNLKQGVQDINTAWDDFNPRAGETLSASLSTASFGNGYHRQQQAPFYQGQHQGSVGSSPAFFSLGTPPSSLSETVSSVNGSDPFGADAFVVPAGESVSSPVYQQNNVSTGISVTATVPPPPPLASRRRTTSSNSGNPATNFFDAAVVVNGVNHNHVIQAPPVNKNVSTASVNDFNNIGASFESPNAVADPFDTSHVSRLVNGIGATPSYPFHAASTPIPRFSSSSSPPFGDQGSFSLEMSQAPSAIVGQRSSPSEISSASTASVFGTTASSMHKTFASPNSVNDQQNSIFNRGAYESQLASPHEMTLFDNTPPFSTPPTGVGATPMADGGTTKPLGMVTTSPIGNGTPQMSSSPQQTLHNANVLKAPNATSVDQAFNVLCNLDALVTPPSNQQSNNGSNGVHKEDLFAHMRPPPKKSINELRGSPPASIVGGNLTNLDGLCSSPVKIQSISPSSFGGFTTANAPPIPPRSSNAALLPPPPSGAGASENATRQTRRTLPQPQPQPLAHANGANGNGFFNNGKSHDPFADDPFFAS